MTTAETYDILLSGIARRSWWQADYGMSFSYRYAKVSPKNSGRNCSSVCRRWVKPAEAFRRAFSIWRVDKNIDLRENIHLVELAIFKDNDALQSFRVHPEHRKLTDFMGRIADWHAGDIPVDL